MIKSTKTILLGEPAQILVERALSEFRSGRPVLITYGGDAITALPVDAMTETALVQFRLFSRPIRPFLLITARRARAIGVDSSGGKASSPIGIALADFWSLGEIFSLASATQVNCQFKVVPVHISADAAIQLAKHARRLPALLIGAGNSDAVRNCEPPLVAVPAEGVAQYRRASAATLSFAAEATIPLGGFSARFVVFRESGGGTPLAVIVGSPDLTQSVPVRLHSACLTGDVFGSRRCDCGDQLRLALTQLAQHGGGIVLYLEQEGRGLGLANKLRTYQLQDGGLDTIDANSVIGFDDDERDYGIAVRMLQMLGCTRVRLLTNNPSKLEALSRGGIDVVGRMPLQGPINADNRRYLAAKATRSGHQLDHVLGAFAEPEVPAKGAPARRAVRMRLGGRPR
jgi:GTP cyclohydrolase II